MTSDVPFACNQVGALAEQLHRRAPPDRRSCHIHPRMKIIPDSPLGRWHRPPGNAAAVFNLPVILLQMRRTLAVVVLLAAMLWQTLAIGEAGAPRAHSDDRAHAALHWQDIGHHHHDGGYHLDDSDESAQHLVADGALTFLALWSDALPLADDSRPLPPVPSAEAAIPEPNPERIKRPPRLAI